MDLVGLDLPRRSTRRGDQDQNLALNWMPSVAMIGTPLMSCVGGSETVATFFALPVDWFALDRDRAVLLQAADRALGGEAVRVFDAGRDQRIELGAHEVSVHGCVRIDVLDAGHAPGMRRRQADRRCL